MGGLEHSVPLTSKTSPQEHSNIFAIRQRRYLVATDFKNMADKNSSDAIQNSGLIF